MCKKMCRTAMMTIGTLSAEEPDKRSRQFALFNVVNFKNEGCASTSSRWANEQNESYSMGG